MNEQIAMTQNLIEATNKAWSTLVERLNSKYRLVPTGQLIEINDPDVDWAALGEKMYYIGQAIRPLNMDANGDLILDANGKAARKLLTTGKLELVRMGDIDIEVILDMIGRDNIVSEMIGMPVSSIDSETYNNTLSRFRDWVYDSFVLSTFTSTGVHLPRRECWILKMDDEKIDGICVYSNCKGSCPACLNNPEACVLLAFYVTLGE